MADNKPTSNAVNMTLIACVSAVALIAYSWISGTGFSEESRAGNQELESQEAPSASDQLSIGSSKEPGVRTAAAITENEATAQLGGTSLTIQVKLPLGLELKGFGEVTLQIMEFDRAGIARTLNGVVDTSGACGPMTLRNGTFAVDVLVGQGDGYRAMSSQVLIDVGKSNYFELTLVPIPTLRLSVRSDVGALPGCTVELTEDRSGELEVLWSGSCDGYGVVEIPWQWTDKNVIIVPRMEGFCPAARPRIISDYIWTDQSSSIELLMLLAGGLEITVVDQAGGGVANCPLIVSWTGQIGGLDLMHHGSVKVEALTDAHGMATISPVPSGAFFEIQAQSADGRRSMLHFAGKSGLDLQLVELVLKHQNTNELRVLDQEGNPVQGARVGVGREELGLTNALGRVIIQFPESEEMAGLTAWVFSEDHAF